MANKIKINNDVKKDTISGIVTKNTKNYEEAKRQKCK